MTRGRIFALTLAVTMATASGLAFAQHQGHTPAPLGSAPPAGDTREFVGFPAELRDHTLANMRDHLLALQEIQEYLAREDYTAAAKIAEERLGMSSLALHGAHEVAKYMPPGMQDAGGGMHRAASRFAIEAQNSAVTGEMKPTIAALASVTAQCVGCHASYRLK
jgi:hypothetical protein